MYAKCIKLYDFGDPSTVLTVENCLVPSPQKNEILVRMTARPINPSDLIPIRGTYSHRITLPIIPGYEGCGVVTAVGSNVCPTLIGKRVLPLRGAGTWQEYVTSPADLAVIIPDEIDDFTAAQMYINPLTASVTLKEVLRIKKGDTLLVNACGSSIGYIYAQLARIIGCKLIAITRNNRHTERLLSLGASHVINTSESPLKETVLSLTNGIGADAAIDSIGGEDGNSLAFCIRPNGYFLTIGLLSGIQVDWAHIVKNAKVHAHMFHLRHWNKEASVEKWQRTFQEIIEHITNGSLQLRPISESFTLSSIKGAVEMVASSNGKIILTSP